MLAELLEFVLAGVAGGAVSLAAAGAVARRARSSCSGCGGDLCVCVCGGERECAGCEMCSEYEDVDIFGDGGLGFG